MDKIDRIRYSSRIENALEESFTMTEKPAETKVKDGIRTDIYKDNTTTTGVARYQTGEQTRPIEYANIPDGMIRDMAFFDKGALSHVSFTDSPNGAITTTVRDRKDKKLFEMTQKGEQSVVYHHADTMDEVETVYKTAERMEMFLKNDDIMRSQPKNVYSALAATQAMSTITSKIKR
jgi:hypothetical protein